MFIGFESDKRLAVEIALLAHYSCCQKFLKKFNIYIALLFQIPDNFLYETKLGHESYKMLVFIFKFDA